MKKATAAKKTRRRSRLDDLDTIQIPRACTKPRGPRRQSRRELLRAHRDLDRFVSLLYGACKERPSYAVGWTRGMMNTPESRKHDRGLMLSHQGDCVGKATFRPDGTAAFSRYGVTVAPMTWGQCADEILKAIRHDLQVAIEAHARTLLLVTQIQLL